MLFRSNSSDIEKLENLCTKLVNKDKDRINIISSTKLIDDMLCKNSTVTLTKRNYREIIDCKQCILPCINIQPNIFEWDVNIDPNYSSHLLLNNIGISYLSKILFIYNEEQYFPEKVDIYLNNKHCKTMYKDLIIGSDSTQSNMFNNSSQKKYYCLTDSPFPLSQNIKVKIVINDPN